MSFDLLLPVEIYAFLLFYLWVLWAGVSVLVGLMFGLEVVEVTIFNGRTKREYEWHGIRIVRKTIPVSCSVRFRNRLDPPVEVPVSADRAPILFEDLSPVRGAILALSGCISLAVLSIAACGFDDALKQLVSAYPQLVLGAMLPHTQGVALLEGFYAAHDESWWVAFGVLSSKMLAINLIPFLGSPSYSALTFLRLAGLRPGVAEDIPRVFYLLFFLGLALLGGWTLAMVFYLLQPFI